MSEWLVGFLSAALCMLPWWLAVYDRGYRKGFEEACAAWNRRAGEPSHEG